MLLGLEDASYFAHAMNDRAGLIPREVLIPTNGGLPCHCILLSTNFGIQIPKKPPCQGGEVALFSAPFSAIYMRTISAKANEVKRQWWLIDAADQVLGRVASKAANLLRGKEKAIFTPHVDTGDFVIV